MNPEEKDKNYKLGETLLAEQDFQNAVLFGFIASALAAGVWGAIAASTGFIVSYMAIGVGALVGFAVQIGGKGISNKFAVVASLLSIIGCTLGNLIAAVILEASEYQVSVSEILSDFDMVTVADFLIADFQFADMIFWIMAVGAAAYFSKRRLSREQGLAIYTLRRRSEDSGTVT